MTIFTATPGLTERTWPSILQSPISVNGNRITVQSTLGIKVKMIITLTNAGVDPEDFEVKRVYDNKNLAVGPVGKNIHKTFGSEIAKFDGGTLAAAAQSRNKLGDAPIIRAVYEEEPTIALRTIGVGPTGKLDGTPGAALEIIPPDARFLYGCAFETTAIREYTPSEKLSRGNIDVSSGGSTIDVAQLEPWMAIGSSIYVMKVLPGDVTESIGEFEITDITGTVLDVTPAPGADYTGDGLIDGSIGDPVKVTNFEYGNAFEVTNIYTTSSNVTADDIVKKVR